jgi:hypothetical protein
MNDSTALRAMARRVAEQRQIVRGMGEGFSELYRKNNELEHARHGAWRRWKVTGRVLGWAYQLGVIGGYGYQGNSACHPMCVSGVRWRGRRLYILGWSRGRWACLLRYHHRRREVVDAPVLCSVCCPCPECGSTDADHWDCEMTS